MKRKMFITSILITLMIVGAALGQSEEDESFAFQQQIGRERPQSILYNPPFNQFAVVDERGRLLILDATNYSIQHTLHETGAYNAYKFSHDGRWMALAIELRIELWNTQTGELSTTLEPEGALSITGPLIFAPDDVLLLFTNVIRAPSAIRRSENDTSNVPYLWDIRAARREAQTTLPNNIRAYPFFDYRNGFILGANNKVIAALPDRVNILDISQPGFPVINTINTFRSERDPMDIWFSRTDDQMYFRPLDQSNLTQINTNTGNDLPIPIGLELNYAQLPDYENLLLSANARIVGEPNSLNASPFLRLLLGDDYRANWNYHPLTVMILDILQPVTVSDDQAGLLIYIFDEQTGRGVIDFLRPQNIIQMKLHPDNTRFMVRRASGQQPIEVYNMDTGLLEYTYFPTFLSDGRSLLEYNVSGDVILTDFEQFEAATGSITFQDLSYAPMFDQYFFTQDSQHLVTISGSNWWLWDIASNQVLRREIINIRGTILQTTPDAHRFLTRIDTPKGPGIEIVEVGMDERRSITFENPLNLAVNEIIPSPNWDNFIITYSNDDIALYNLYEGKRWYIARDELPSSRSYRWADNETALVSGQDYRLARSPRVYGLDYHPSGLPNCLVLTFPDDWPRWIDLWERLNLTLSFSNLAQLTHRLCDALPGTTQDIDNIFSPSPTPTLIPFSTPSHIAGVPECLTANFPSDALEYAQVWREMTVGLSNDDIAELSETLCRGLQETVGASGFSEGQNTFQVMTIDVNTGIRVISSYFPPPPPPEPDLNLVLSEFERTKFYSPDYPVLSPDGQLLGIRNFSGHIELYRLIKPYEQLSTDATATIVALTPVDSARSISLRPTATLPPEWIGQPQPTVTPTITPTPPPLPTMQVAQSQFGKIEELCPALHLYNIANPPPHYSATGRFIVSVNNSYQAWVLDGQTGRLYADETIPACTINQNCQFSFSRNWILVQGDDIYVARPDGTQKQILFRAIEHPAWPESIYWLDTSDTVEYRYQGQILGKPERRDETIIQQIPMNTNQIPSPVRPRAETIEINELTPDIISRQPGDGPLLVVRLGDFTKGLKYYIYDRTNGLYEYFARVTQEFEQPQFEWHPLGTSLYYRYQNSDIWYIYDPIMRQHRVLGDYPTGQWSRNARYKVQPYFPTQEELDTHKASGTLPPEISLWDSQTGLTRRYCIPEANFTAYGPTLHWSPDGRYVAFHIPLEPETILQAATSTALPSDGSFASPYVLILDTETGYVTKLSDDVNAIVVWTFDAGQEIGK